MTKYCSSTEPINPGATIIAYRASVHVLQVAQHLNVLVHVQLGAAQLHGCGYKWVRIHAVSTGYGILMSMGGNWVWATTGRGIQLGAGTNGCEYK
jgi:hypothetical protein